MNISSNSMNVNGANTQIGQMGMNQVTDSYSKNIQNQIANAQKQQAKVSDILYNRNFLFM